MYAILASDKDKEKSYPYHGDYYVKPIDATRGLPNDLSEGVKKEHFKVCRAEFRKFPEKRSIFRDFLEIFSSKEKCGHFDFSWLLLKELLAYDWKRVVLHFKDKDKIKDFTKEEKEWINFLNKLKKISKSPKYDDVRIVFWFDV